MNGFIEAGYVVGIGGVGAYALGLAIRVRHLEKLLVKHPVRAHSEAPAPPSHPGVP